MRDKRVKSIITQWIIPFSILLVVVYVMLIQFSITSRSKEFEEVEEFLVDSAEDYASQFRYTLESLTTAAEPLADFMENYTYEEVEIAENIEKAIIDNTHAYQVVMCNVMGEGMLHSGERVDLSVTDYFQKVTEGNQQYIYSHNDGIQGRDCVIAVIPLCRGEIIEGFMLVYYDTANFINMIRQMEFDSSAYYALVDAGGKVIFKYGAQHELFQDEAIWEGIMEKGLNTDDLKKAKKRFDADLSGMQKIEISEDGDAQAFIYAPVVEGWKVVIGMNYDYIETLQRREWADTRMMLNRLILCILVFLGAIAVISVIVKLREIEKNKDLAKKADTDLLTGLNNKAATERKIRAYIDEHADEQALLFVLDIDNFKKINDTMGHAFGDEVLRELGHQIQAYFRVTDIIGRTGGDEFMIFLKGMKDNEIILKEAKKLDYFFKNFQAGEYVKYSATASIGAAVYPRDAADFESLYKAADKALYTAKQRGKNQIAFCDEQTFKR